jgi:muramoyltetrapeptide carboxypeptidase
VVNQPSTLPLKKGARIGVVSPGFAVRPRALRAGLRWLESLGFKPQLAPHALEQSGYLAGDDLARGDDLEQMLADPEIDCVWFSRGGYGTARLLDRIPWRAFKRHPKTIVGYSDATALICCAAQRSGATAIHGPMVSELGESGRYHRPSLMRLLQGKAFERRIGARSVLSPGHARGELVGGNLTVLTHLLGTRHFPRLDDRILFLEEVGEPVYRIDRLLTQWAQAGLLGRPAGIILGSFTIAPRRAFPPDRPLRAVLRERFVDLGIPVIDGFPAGHRRGNWSLPIGGTAEIDSNLGLLRMEP